MSINRGCSRLEIDVPGRGISIIKNEFKGVTLLWAKRTRTQDQVFLIVWRFCFGPKIPLKEFSA